MHNWYDTGWAIGTNIGATAGSKSYKKLTHKRIYSPFRE
jgi:hypothetical protein